MRRATLFIALLALWNLGDPRGASHPDEQYYMAISAEMQRAGTWATPTLDGQPLFYKPPLLYWFERVTYDAVGLSIVGARLPAALCLVGLSFVAALLGASFGASGALCALLTGGSLGLFAYGRLAMTDVPLALILAGAFFCVWRARERQSPRWLCGAGVLGGAGMLLKGPVALVVLFVGAAAFAFLAERRVRDPLRRLLWITVASAIALAVAAPWYLLMLSRHGRNFFDFFFVQMNFDRFTSPWHASSLVTLWGGFLVALLPWMPLGVAAIAHALSRGRWRDERRLFLLCWAGATLAVFSLPAQKWPHYGLPAVVPIAILVALFASESRHLRTLHIAAAAGLGVLGLLLSGVAPALGYSPWPAGALPQRPLAVYGQPQGLIELSSGRVASRLWHQEEIANAIAARMLVWIPEREWHSSAVTGATILASTPRFRSGAGIADVWRACREGRVDQLLEQILVVGLP